MLIEQKLQSRELLRVLVERGRRLSVGRLGLFFAAVGALVWWVAFDGTVAAFGIFVLLAACFILLVRIHTGVKVQERYLRAVVRMREMRIAAYGRDWTGLPHISPHRDSLPHWADELDVVGETSLLRLLGGTLTLVGRLALESFLFEGAKPEAVARRQGGVRELAGRMELIDELQADAILAPSWSAAALQPFLDWAEKRDESSGVRLRLVAARVTTAVVILVGTLAALGLVPWSALLLVVLCSAVVAMALAGFTRARLSVVEGREEPVAAFGRMLRLLESSRFESVAMLELQHRAGSDSVPASQALLALRRILLWSEIRYSPMMHSVLQVTLLWDAHLVGRLERWRRLHGVEVREWLNALGEFEACGALAVLCHSNPSWCFPTVTSPTDQLVVSCKDLGHPLIPEGVRVGNDVSVGPPGTFLLVTGSNMSGKSTLLRSLGVNIVLAQAGGPVCASNFTMPAVVLASSVQVQDSLSRGVSRFMAEVLRLRDVVEMARAVRSDHDPIPLYLLDEILQGTNSAERQIGARRVIAELLERRCVGVVTTHDLALADSPELNSSAQMVHFTEGVAEVNGEIVLSFEYKLLPGMAESVNALKLMQAVGL